MMMIAPPSWELAGRVLTLADRRYRTVRTWVRLPVAGAVAGA